MSYKGELPGMYYDREKGKYFMVQATGAAPATSAYSSYDVKRRKLVDERTQDIKKEAIRQRGRIRRSILDPLTGGILRRECGNGNGSLDGPQIFANGLVSQGFTKEGPPFGLIFDVQNLRNVPPMVEQNFGPITGQDFGPMIELHTLCEDRLTTVQWTPTRTLGYSRIHEHLGHSGQSTSICIHEGRQKLVATWLAESPNSGIAIVPTGVNDELNPIVILGPGTSRGAEIDVHSSAAAPERSSLLFAIGTSEGIITIDNRYADMSFLSRSMFPDGHAKDVFALEFLSNDPNVLMSGGRNGILNITDLRVAGFGSQADFIRHPSSITHIKQIDDHRIIVAGLQSSLRQYDLRFRKTAARTQCILQYPEYHNTSTIRIGFDVDLESGVVAAAQEHDINHPPMQLFSLHGGHVLQPGRRKSAFDDMGTLFPMERDDIIPCVRFARDRADGVQSLFVSADAFRRSNPEWQLSGNGRPADHRIAHVWIEKPKVNYSFHSKD